MTGIANRRSATLQGRFTGRWRSSKIRLFRNNDWS
jgi:hypothetical protein